MAGQLPFDKPIWNGNAYNQLARFIFAYIISSADIRINNDFIGILRYTFISYIYGQLFVLCKIVYCAIKRIEARYLKEN